MRVRVCTALPALEHLCKLLKQHYVVRLRSNRSMLHTAEMIIRCKELCVTVQRVPSADDGFLNLSLRRMSAAMQMTAEAFITVNYRSSLSSDALNAVGVDWVRASFQLLSTRWTIWMNEAFVIMAVAFWRIWQYFEIKPSCIVLFVLQISPTWRRSCQRELRRNFLIFWRA